MKINLHMDLKSQKLYNKLLKESGLESNRSNERQVFNEHMSSLASQGVNCFSCSGLCCTFISNSVQTDPAQTLELYAYLNDENRWNDELIAQLHEVVRFNRLDYEIQTGTGSTFRRTYTCPFYTKGAKGCSIDPNSKPYGCLGFNPRSVGASEGSDCGADLAMLMKREAQNEAAEAVANDYLKNLLGLDWDKLPMPLALIKLDKSIQSKDWGTLNCG